MEKFDLKIEHLADIDIIQQGIDRQHGAKVANCIAKIKELQNYLHSVELAKISSVKGYLMAVLSQDGVTLSELVDTPQLSEDGKSIVFDLTE
jgi:hypothetical protein